MNSFKDLNLYSFKALSLFSLKNITCSPHDVGITTNGKNAFACSGIRRAAQKKTSPEHPTK
ncbi:TPA: hypothetical protein I8Y16_004054 [Raoultella ornithinolytica]|nr:hypothetical protein [Raoultella ornithinolytica]HAT1670199.1 hypothetical protein [Raoultella ornithinolytica]